MKMSRQLHRSLGVQNAVFYVLFVLAVGLLAFLGKEFGFQADWTYGNRNSLSDSTRALLGAIDQPLKFVAYVPDDPALQEQLRKIVGKYQRINPNIGLEFVNPDLEPVRAKQDGIQYAGQLSIQLGGRSELVEATSESVLANAIQRMSRGGERLVVFLEGHGERNPLAQESTGMSQLLAQLERSGFTVQPHNLVRSQSIPNNARFLVIAAPQQEILPGEVAVLKQYVEQGGNLLWLHEPGGLRGLQPLADVLGLKIADGTVLDANQELHQLLGVTHPAVVPVVDYGRLPWLAKLTGLQTLFPFATQVLPNPARPEDALAWQTDELLFTLPNSWLETGVVDGAVSFEEDKGDQLGPITLGVVLARLLEQPADLAKTDSVLPVNSQSERQQRVAVVGDSDFMLNAFIGQGANLELANSLFNWLSADDKLLDVPVVQAPDNQLALGEAASLVLAVFFLLALPGLLVLAGVVIWWRRRRR